MTKVFYRKYRPLTFQDVVGQEHITCILQNEVRENRPAHAYLFTGTHGTGKTTCSKILARAVNCLNPKEGDPCNQCEVCLGLESGSILDVTEMDAASNNSIEDVRLLREETNYTPAVCKYRVYIIDEVHMLSINAFNALLKIMEEPPPHVIFILATTEVHKIPATILSRCQTFSFHRIQEQDICNYLGEIAEKEGFVLEQNAGMLIAKLAKGAMRDALSILNVCASQGETITYDMVTKLTGRSTERYLSEATQHIISYDCAKALQVLDHAYHDSVSAMSFCQQWIEYFRDLMLHLSLQTANKQIQEGSVQEHAVALGMSRILQALHVLQKTLDRMSTSTMRELQLEIAMVALCTPAEEDHGKMQEKLKVLERAVSSLEEKWKSIAEGTVHISQPSVASKPMEQPIVAVGETMKKNAPPLKQWIEILERLKKKNGALYGALKDSRAFTSEDVLLIQCNNEVFLSLIRENEYTRKTLREAAQEVTGQRYKLGPFRENLYVIQQDDPLENFINKLDTSCEEIELK